MYNMEKCKVTNKKPVQLEFVFNTEENFILSNSDFSICKKKKNYAKIININDRIIEMKKKKNTEVLNYILNNSKRF